MKLYKKRGIESKVYFTLKVIPANKDQITIPWYVKQEDEEFDLVFFNYSEDLGLYNIEKNIYIVW